MKAKKTFPKWLNFVIREAIIFGMIATLSGLLMMEQTGPKNFRYPLSATPQVKELFNNIGSWLFLFGYPCIAAIRLFIYVLRKKNA